MSMPAQTACRLSARLYGVSSRVVRGALPAFSRSTSGTSAGGTNAREKVIGAAKGAVAVEPVRGSIKPPKKEVDDKCGPLPAEEDDLSDMVQMVDPGTQEWGGPTKGGSMPEPTRFGDWERKGRCTDFC